MIRAIAFDFDGVLVESVDIKTRAFARLFAHEDPETVGRIIAYHLKNGGISRFEKLKTIYRDILHSHLSDEQFVSLCDQYAELVVDEVVKAPWVRGAQDFLSRHRTHFLFFVVSGTPQEELREIVRRRNAEGLFDEVLGSPATKSFLLNHLLEKHHLDANDVVFVGDAESDWVAASEVGLRFIWRQADNNSWMPANFGGPVIPSLADLDACLASHET